MKTLRRLSILVAGVMVASALAVFTGAGVAQAKGPGDHPPIICKMGGGAAVDGTGICGRRDQNTGGPRIEWDSAWYKYYDDASPYAPLADPQKFPKSDGGLNCELENDGNLRCWRYVPSTATAGRDDCNLSQLKDTSSYACRGSVVEAIFEKDESVAGPGSRMCTPETIYYGKGNNGQPRYYSQAMQCYDTSGLPTVPTVVWYRFDGKGKNHAGTIVGTTKGYLSSGSAADALSEPAATVTTTSTLTPGQFTEPGSRADYTVTVRSSTAGSAVVSLHVGALDEAVEDTVPLDWVRLSSLSDEFVTYLIPHLDAGGSTTAYLHFTVRAYWQAFISVDVNGATASSIVNIRPAAPVCTAPDTSDGAAIAIAGSGATILPGVSCTVQADTTLTEWRGNQRGAGMFTVDGESIRYVPASADFRGADTIYVYTVNAGSVASLPTAVHVNVVDKATPVDDEFTVKMEERTTLDAAHGLMANDTFPGGSDAWSVVSNGVEADGAVQIGEHGELVVEPGRHFTGDLSFQYKLTAPHGQGTAPATVTIHVVE